MPPRAEPPGGRGIDPVVLRAYQPGDLDTVIGIFQRSIRGTAHRDYSPAEVTAWSEVDRGAWEQRRQAAPTWIAEHRGEAAGFIDVEPNGHLDMLYVDPDHQRCGVASALLRQVEQAAWTAGLPAIFTEASRTALPFFLQRGFTVLAEQTVALRGQRLTNFRMEKRSE